MIDWAVAELGIASSAAELSRIAASVSDSGGVFVLPALQAGALRGVEPIMSRGARVAFLLEGEGPETLVASVLGGVGADFRVAGARLPEAGRDTGGVVELVPPGSGAVPGGPRSRANVALAPVPGGAGDPDVVRDDRLFAPPERNPAAPFSAEDAARAVVDAAVDVLKLRGEPVSFAGLLGEILVGLDRAGHLRRLVRPPAPPDDAAPDQRPEPSLDHVERLLALIRDALAGVEGRRLVRIGDDRWWLGERADRDAAAAPLADRVEWAATACSTAGPPSEAALIGSPACSWPRPPDEALVRACLDSHRSIASTAEVLVTTDDLTRRSRSTAS
jgi:hypothetical protein